MKLTITALILALGVAASASAEEPASPQARAARRTQTITQPDWLVKPSSEDLSRVYPKVASALGLEGRVDLKCTVDLSGSLAGCRVAAESPIELGFGAAALLLSRDFKMRPMTVDGVPTPGGNITIPINFRLPPPPLSAPRQVTPETLALARQLMATREEGDPEYKAKLAQYFAPPDVFPDDGATPLKTRIAAAEALQTVVRAHAQEIEDLPELAIASRLTRDELRVAVQVLVLNQPPQPQPQPSVAVERVEDKLTGSHAAVGEASEQLFYRMQAEARAAFCKMHDCGVQLASGGQRPPRGDRQ